MPLSVDAIDLLRKDGLPLCSFALPVAILSFMVLLSKHFAKQFVIAGGLSAIKACGMLTRPSSNRMREQVAHYESQSTKARNFVGHQLQLLLARRQKIQSADEGQDDRGWPSEGFLGKILQNAVATHLGDSGTLAICMRNTAISHSVTGLIRDSLNTLSFIARQTHTYYPRIVSANLECEFRLLLWDTDHVIRGKLCNLLGNLCKHSDACYPMLARNLPDIVGEDSRSALAPHVISGRLEDHCQIDKARSVQGHTLIAHLSTRLRDSDPTTRKFAAFAVGNAAFHSDALYSCLQVTVASLVEALRHDEIHKTRANAAGALGNLVRNSPLLCPSLVKARAPQALLHTALNDSDIQPQRIALFSLGNLCVYMACRDVLLTGDENDMMLHLGRLERDVNDKTAIKYIQRIRSKLAKPGFEQHTSRRSKASQSVNT